ncbi:hypothetical protein HK100_006966, partial [Physocladia obscura]
RMKNQNNGAKNIPKNSSSTKNKDAASGAPEQENMKQHELEEDETVGQRQHQLAHAPHAAPAAQPELSSAIESNTSNESIESIKNSSSSSSSSSSRGRSRSSSGTNGLAPALNTASVSAAAESDDARSQQQHKMHPKAHTHRLVIRQQPLHSRMCGFGEKVDRRPVDPPPIIQLEITSAGTPEDIAYLYNPYYFMYASLVSTDNENEIHILHDGKTRSTTGSIVSSLYRLRDLDNKDGAFFVFPDLSVRMEGSYRLKFSLFEIINSAMYYCTSIVSNVFNVYSAKKFPGMEESTFLSKAFAEQGLKIRIRKELRVRSRTAKNQQANGNEVSSDKKKSSLDSDDEEQSDGHSDSTDHVNKKGKKERSSSDGPTNPPNGSAISLQNEIGTKNPEFPYKQLDAAQQPPQQRHANNFNANAQFAHHPRALYHSQYPPAHYPPSSYYPPPPQQYQQYPRPIGGPNGSHAYAPYPADAPHLRPPPADDSYGSRYSGEFSSPALHGYPAGPGYGGYYYGGPYPPHGYYPPGPPQGYYGPPPPASYPIPPQVGRGYPVGPGGPMYARPPANGNYPPPNDASAPSPSTSGNPSSPYPPQPPPPPPQGQYMGYYYPNGPPPHMAGGYPSRPPPPNQPHPWGHAPPPHHPVPGHAVDPNAPSNGAFYPPHLQDGSQGYVSYPPAANGPHAYYQQYGFGESPTRRTAPPAQQEPQQPAYEGLTAVNGAANPPTLNSAATESGKNDGSSRLRAPVSQATENWFEDEEDDDHVRAKLEGNV